MILSLTSKTRFFKLFIENKNLIKQGLYLLEICQNAVGSTDIATDHHGFCLPILVQFSSAALFITLDGRYDGSLRAQRSIEGLRFKILDFSGIIYCIILKNSSDFPDFLQSHQSKYMNSCLINMNCVIMKTGN